jgi:hypothetical protein
MSTALFHMFTRTTPSMPTTMLTYWRVVSFSLKNIDPATVVASMTSPLYAGKNTLLSILPTRYKLMMLIMAYPAPLRVVVWNSLFRKLFHEITPIFNELQYLKEQGELWRNIKVKEERL